MLQVLFQAEMRLDGALLGLGVEETRAGKSSSWKVFLPWEEQDKPVPSLQSLG